MDLTFITTEKNLDKQYDLELIQNGAKTPVTKENKLKYLSILVDYKLNIQIKKQTEAFVSGFHSIIPLSQIKIFSELELSEFINGSENCFSIEDFKRNVVYEGYSRNSKTITLFWKIISEMKKEELKKFLVFVTASENPPLLGFSEFNPKITIRKTAYQERSTQRFPSSNTCINLLKLPPYQKLNNFREKLKEAINNPMEFHLS